MEGFLNQIQPILNTPIFSWGKTQFSFSSLVLIAFSIFVVSISANLLSRLFRRSLLLALKLDRGVQEAITSIFNYLILGLGAIVVLQTAGIDLSSLTVIAGVLGIGLGLGVQNFTSSFVSGLVLQFEQTIKVGDYIEVGGLAGTVEKISIRSTLIRTTDNMFVIVPNLQLIESKTINWSYGGHTCRIHLPIAIAYESDPLLVTEALLVAARNEPLVLSHPEPEVWLDGMGDHGLKFELLVWINQPELSLPIKSSLYFQIEQELRLRQIQVPFPQLDLHIKKSGRKNLGLNRRFKSSPANSEPLTISPSLGDLLRQVTYFESCSASELRSLIASGYRQTFGENELICRENDPSESFYLMLSGSVEVVSERTGKRIATLAKGDFFGEISLLMGIPRTATVRAISPTSVFVVSRQQLEKLMLNHQHLAEQIAQALAERQQVLIDLGILLEEDLNRKESAALDWVRSRLSLIFGIQFNK